MKYLAIIILIVFLSCTNNSNIQCPDVNAETRFWTKYNPEKFLNDSIISEDIELFPANKFEEFIRFEFDDSWTESYIITAYKINKTFFTSFIHQYWEYDSNQSKKCMKTVLKERILNKEDSRLVSKYISKLQCSKIKEDLIIDGGRFYLQVKSKKKIFHYYWVIQSKMKRLKNGKYILDETKNKILPFTAFLARISGIEEPKIRINARIFKSKEKVSYVLYLLNTYFTESYEVFLDNNKLELKHGVAKFDIMIKDTANIIRRIDVFETQYDGYKRKINNIILDKYD